MRALLATVLLCSSCVGPGVMKMGMSLKLDIFGAKAHFKLPVEFYPLLPDAGYPPPELLED